MTRVSFVNILASFRENRASQCKKMLSLFWYVEYAGRGETGSNDPLKTTLLI